MADEILDILKAVSLASRAHQGQLRKDGKTPYVSHPFRVCLIVQKVFGLDEPRILQTALLHDVIEDTTTDYDDLAEQFSPEVAEWVGYLTKDKRLPEEKREEVYLEAIRSAPWQVQVCKLADVYDNMNDVRDLPDSKRATSMKRYKSYLDGLSSIDDPQVRRVWQIVESQYRELTQQA